MPEIQAERRIVKSPPELWAELSEVESLARRLEEFGEIRITRLEPETTVAWEGDDVSGTVELEASGWGTKVRLTVATAGEEPESLPEVEIGPVELAPPPPEPELAPVIPREQAPPPGVSVPPPSVAEASPAPVARRGFIARLLGLRRATPPGETADDSLEGAAAAEVGVAPGAPGEASDVIGEAPGADPVPDAPGETNEVTQEPPAAEADVGAPPRPEPVPHPVESVLAAVLDDLGAAHHRPFSRG